MIRLTLLLSLTVLFLAGCISTGGERPPAQQYRLAVLSSAGENNQSAHHFPVVLRLDRPSAPAWLQTTNMYYQLTYKGRSKIAAYNRSRWVETPPAMLAHALHDALAASGAFQAVVSGSQGASANLALHFHLGHFEQPFMSRDSSSGLLVARVTLANLGMGKVLAQHRFRFRVAAPSADAEGGVQALSSASGKWVGAVTEWVRDTLAKCAPGCLNGSS